MCVYYFIVLIYILVLITAEMFTKYILKYKLYAVIIIILLYVWKCTMDINAMIIFYR